ncbi:three-Cys-motif partner protein TcmP [Clostridium sp.]|uniref:three-Cys-motif partner protein TcmP n=1 Tax=Clostridium sp. TaxID=1506 RepID=UPI001A3F072B|nr:three-Cys-motif partner protein TcmP [Clostridium sp.]MBK5243088.1 three-Cys-motif partner protein TcmP [Clostridium sp.]
MGCTDKFFENKRPWSIFKDRMLSWYLKPYITKLLYMKKPLYIIDCFAGKGKFDDHKDGSPIIIAKQIQEVLEDNNIHNKEVKGIFIEKKYSRELEFNIDGYKKCKACKGTFEDNIERICKARSVGNIFLYIDPYGIKSLKYEYIERICDSSYGNFNSIEMLINFNSNGFIREACRLLKYNISDELIEEHEDNYEAQEVSESYLTKIINSSKWKVLVTSYYKNILAYHEVEEKIVEEYVCSLKEKFKYCLNIPIKDKEKNIPKYRMIFCTNSKDGLLLMNKGMNNTANEMREQELGGQMSLFSLPEIQDVRWFGKYAYELLSQYDETEFIDFVCAIIDKMNILYTESDIRQKLKIMEKQGAITVTRVRKDGSTPSRRLTGWNWKDNKIKIRLVESILINEGVI